MRAPRGPWTSPPLAPRHPLQASFSKVSSVSELKTNGGRQVVVIGGQKVLLLDVDGDIRAVSNKCSHLGLPLQGKILSAEVKNGCVTCAAHGTAFDCKVTERETGRVDWSTSGAGKGYTGGGMQLIGVLLMCGLCRLWCRPALFRASGARSFPTSPLSARGRLRRTSRFSPSR